MNELHLDFAMPAAVRWYAYSPTLGRRRIPQDNNHNEQTAIAWAIAHHADNVTREHGPTSNPHSTTKVWERRKEN